VQRQHGAGDVGARRHEVGDLAPRQRVLLEHRVAERLGQVRDEPGVLAGGERLEIEVEVLREAQQQLRGERPPIVLDQVQVARRDAEPLGHRRLRQVEPGAQGADLLAEAHRREGGRAAARGPAPRGADGAATTDADGADDDRRADTTMTLMRPLGPDGAAGRRPDAAPPAAVFTTLTAPLTRQTEERDDDVTRCATIPCCAARDPR
jgi:hypothetical protein